MGLRDKWYPSAIAAMISIRGEGPLSLAGDRLPLLCALDTVAVLAQLGKPLVDAIGKFQGDAFGSALRDRIVEAKFVDDGVFDPGVLEAVAAVNGAIPASAYVAAPADPGGVPYRRGGHEIATSATYRGDPGMLAAMRGALRNWESAIQVSASIIGSYGANLLAFVSVDDTRGFYAAIKSLCGALDAINANPPPTEYWTQVREGIKKSLEDSGRVAGAAAADVADAVGRTAAAATEGFFDNANSTAIIVGGLAIFLMVR